MGPQTPTWNCGINATVSRVSAGGGRGSSGGHSQGPRYQGAGERKG